MTLPDSSAWVEYLQSGPRATAFAEHLSDADLVVPTVVIYEVYKFMKREVSERDADLTVARLRQYEVVELDEPTALAAADASLEHGLAMADAIVYATAQMHGATLVTGDVDFRELPGVEFIPLDDA